MFLLVCKRNKELGETRKKWFGKQWRREDWRSTLTPNTQHPLIFRRKKRNPIVETRQNKIIITTGTRDKGWSTHRMVVSSGPGEGQEKTK